MANGAGKRGKRTIYFRPMVVDELEKEALRHDRSVSWLLQRAWKLARDEIKSAPARRAALADGGVVRVDETDSSKPRAA